MLGRLLTIMLTQHPLGDPVRSAELAERALKGRIHAQAAESAHRANQQRQTLEGRFNALVRAIENFGKRYTQKSGAGMAEGGSGCTTAGAGGLKGTPGLSTGKEIGENEAVKQRVLILCTGNSARSQMGEGLLRHDAGDRFTVVSAGTSPGRVRGEAIEVMREIGIDISGHRSKSVDEFRGDQFDYVLTVCDNARETCPVFPGAAITIHHAFNDPAASEGSEDERLAFFRRVRDEMRSYLKAFP